VEPLLSRDDEHLPDLGRARCPAVLPGESGISSMGICRGMIAKSRTVGCLSRSRLAYTPRTARAWSGCLATGKHGSTRQAPGGRGEPHLSILLVTSGVFDGDLAPLHVIGRACRLRFEAAVLERFMAVRGRFNLFAMGQNRSNLALYGGMAKSDGTLVDFQPFSKVSRDAFFSRPNVTSYSSRWKS